LPPRIPPISFPSGTDGAVAVPINIVGGGGAPVVATPELAILRRHALSFLGVKLATIANPPL